jgi:hypothetical protein
MCPPRSDNLLGGEVPRRVCGSGARYHEGANRVPSAAHPSRRTRPYPVSQRSAAEMDFDARRLRQSPARRPPRPAPRCSPAGWLINQHLSPTKTEPHQRRADRSPLGGHIGTCDSAVTDVTDGAISRRRSPVANFTIQSILNWNIVTFANVVLIACSVARTDSRFAKL